MNFFKHTEKWFSGEAFEGGMLLVFGTLLVILALYFWKFGNSPPARVMILPILLVGLFWGGAAGIGLWRNTVHLEAYRTEFAKAPAEFVKYEKNRVEGIRRWYRPLLIGWSLLIVVGLISFNFWGGNLGRAIGLATILFAAAGLMVDHTSESNADDYYTEIRKALK